MGNDVAALIDRAQALDALRSYTARLATILRREPAQDVHAIGSWTLGEVANHVVSGMENYTRWLKGLDAPDVNAINNMARWNIEPVRGLPSATPPQLADRIERATEEFIHLAQEKSPLSQVRWYAGNEIPIEVAVAMRLVEAAVHGLDIATAVNERWGIDPDDARTISYGLGYVAPHFVDGSRLEFDGAIRMRIRGGADLYYVVTDRKLEVRTEGPPRPGWTLSVDPVAWVLVSTGRRNQWTAALRGTIIGWGTRPTLPFRLRAASFQG